MTDDRTGHAAAHPHGHERVFWRKLAHWGASRGPEWWVRYSPPVFGWAAALLVPSARRAVLANLHRIRGEASPVRDARDVLATFSTYASCLAEVLSNDAAQGPRTPRATIYGERFLKQAFAARRGAVLVTAHTAGWDSVGPLLARDYGLDVMLVMQPEPDHRSRALHDHARRRAGVVIAHVGDDPLASLPLLRHLRSGGVVALQLDRAADGMRMRRVSLLGRTGAIPEGPLRLAQMSGAPLLPVFCARAGYRDYVIEAFEPVHVDRHASEAALSAAAEHLAAAMTSFLRAHPTQWLKFTVDTAPGAV
jgi:KDO2-lipid IV(A) lauroyltransferase